MWGGPFININEMEQSLAKRNKTDKIVRTELAYYRLFHKLDFAACPYLYKLNHISPEERLENLMILLSETDYCTDTPINLPTNLDVISALNKEMGNRVEIDQEKIQKNSQFNIKVNEMCCTLWTVNGKKQWFLGYVVTDFDANAECIVDHLERHKDSDTIWKCPTSSDKQKVKREQILNCPIEGEWDMESSDRALKFHLNNLAKVVKLYSKLL